MITIIIIIIFISNAALSKIRHTVGTCHSVLTKRCAFRSRAKVAVDSVDRRSSAGKLLQVSGPETAKFLRPMAVAVRCTSSLQEAADRRCQCPVRWTTGWQSSARYGGASLISDAGHWTRWQLTIFYSPIWNRWAIPHVIMPVNLPGGSTVQWGTGWGLMCWHQLITVAIGCWVSGDVSAVVS